MPNAADAARARFRQDVERLAGVVDARRLGIAVSGGADSMALLWLAHGAFPSHVAAATVDHGLRPEAADEAAMVARWCAAHGVPHATLRPAVPIAGNLQSEARAARYALLDGWATAQGIDWIMTAHHADDQLETLLMRLNRGSGVAGLAGVRARNGRVLRPLLGWRKAELLAIATAQGLPVAHDPSNADPRFDRVAMRQALQHASWLDVPAAARSAAALAEAEEALAWTARHLADRITPSGDAWHLDMDGLPRELARRLFLAALAEADPALRPRGDAVDVVIAAATTGGKASIGDWLVMGGRPWRLYAAPPRRTTLRPD